MQLLHRLKELYESADDSVNGELLEASSKPVDSVSDPNLNTISLPRIIAEAELIRAKEPHLRGATVAIRYQGLNDFVRLLLAFDGWSAALYLLPEDDAPQLPDDCQFWAGLQSDVKRDTSLPEGQHVVTHWYIATSGTTSKPKWIAHQLAGLTASVRVNLEQMPLRWGLLYQPFRFAGLQVLLQGLLSGASIVDASDGDISRRIKLLRAATTTALSATPSMWRQLLLSGELETLPLSQLTLGGEIADQGLLNMLRARFSEARIIHIYASTEAGVGFSVSDGKAGFPEAWLKDGYYGVKLKINAHHHLCIKPLQLPKSGVKNRMDAQGYIDSEDMVEIIDGRVYFLGRAGGVINVGGNKVHPQQVEQVILSIEGVLSARVYGSKSSVMGSLVSAEVVAEADTELTALKKKIILQCMQRLARYQVPMRIDFVKQIKTNETGKIDRRQPSE
ncbi:AMP-binding protein [Lacimicrobium alkaliphilum]|uniref:AMP-dependent synthetase/ligase domain-containing protein n=1 Tax=Lacimicrobium alkaliphilum TaxID=1526571 RepID=A0A0U3ADC4_9ALTE|nr:class I adenylate-forming enzyme family protein [Lacimicrobium alkaliphilum]ALS99070.1 hypothetical protein AT746_12880 [Lacimicrobium alkaliphilum]